MTEQLRSRGPRAGGARLNVFTSFGKKSFIGLPKILAASLFVLVASRSRFVFERSPNGLPIIIIVETFPR